MTPRPPSKQPIPPHARKVFSGILFDVYQWEQELFDGTKTTFEKLVRPDTVVVYPVLPDGRIVLTRQEQPGKAPFLGAAGGRVDAGEDPLEAAHRELREETGYTAKHMKLIDARHWTSKIDWVVYSFVATGITEGGERNLDAGEKIDLMPVTFDEFLEIGCREKFLEKELMPKLYEARLDKEKYEELKKLFSN